MAESGLRVPLFCALVPLTANLNRVPALEHIGSGKVRELYRVDGGRLLMVATDRISAFDVVLDEMITHKGQVLTGLSLDWFSILDTPNHLISADTEEMTFLTPQERSAYAGRAMLVDAADVIPMECVIRGYLYGSSWKEYSAGGGPTTEHLPAGLEMASRLPEPIFTPAIKIMPMTVTVSTTVAPKSGSSSSNMAAIASSPSGFRKPLICARTCSLWRAR